MSAFDWANESEVQEVLEQIRKSDSNTKWAVFGYEGDKTVKLVQSGPGGLEDFRSLLTDDDIFYVVYSLEVKDQDEGGEVFSATKVIFITWVGTKCKPMLKAKSSQHRLPIYKYALRSLQLAAELQILEPEDLTEANILGKLRGTHVEAEGVPAASTGGSGGAAAAAASAPATTSSSSALPSTSRASFVRKDQSTTHVAFKGTSNVNTDANLSFVNADEANGLLADVRNDGTPTNWVLFGHEGKSLKVLGSGSGGYAELEGFFQDEEIVYGVLGLEVADEDGGSEYKTTKYIFISWVGPKVKPLTKARSSQVRVALYKHAKNHLQLAAEIQALERSEISEELIKQKLNATF